MSAFFTLHRDLPREGPGEPADVSWAMEIAETPKSARIFDIACGPGADIGALLAGAPDGQVTALDLHPHFLETVEDQWGNDPRVSTRQGDMLELDDAADLIWCAGAVYFKGITACLTAWAKVLRPGGAIVFSHPCLFTDAPSEDAIGFWDGYPVQGNKNILSEIQAAGFATLASKKVSDAAWTAYYEPQDSRIAMLRPGAGPDLVNVLDKAQHEHTRWRAVKDETGYLLSVVRPK